MGRKDRKMTFEEVKATSTRANGAVYELFEAFLASDAEVGVVKDWEGDYKTVASLYNACKNLSMGAYKNKVKTLKNGQHVYLERVKEK